jgi:ribosomal protein S18 acetylase RimI-like enzyme
MKELIAMPKTEIRPIRFDDCYTLAEIDVSVGCIGEAFKPSPLPHWDHNAFVRAMNDSKTQIIVAQFGNKPVGYLVTRKVSRTKIAIDRIAVDVFYRRRNVGTELLCDLIQEAYVGEAVRKIQCIVPERNLEMQVFLRANGFLATGVVRSEIGGDDRFSFEVSIPSCVGA